MRKDVDRQTLINRGTAHQPADADRSTHMGHSNSSEKADVALWLHLVKAGQDSPHISCQCHQHFNPFVKQCQAQSKYCDSTIIVMITDTTIHKNQRDKIHNSAADPWLINLLSCNCAVVFLVDVVHL